MMLLDPRSASTAFSRASTASSMAMVPRWVFALLRGPLLSSHTPLSPHRISSDARLALMNLYSSLATPPLVTAIYPGLHAYTDPERLTQSDLALSWEVGA